MIRFEENRLVREVDGEILWMEPWGPGLRVRVGRTAFLREDTPGALGPKPPTSSAQALIEGDRAELVWAGLRATLSDGGRVSISDHHGKVILAERWRNRDVAGASYSALNVSGRELKPLAGDAWRATLRLEAEPSERLYGMGQYQDGKLNLKGCLLELAQRNSQASVPFLLSSRGYGFLWNNPAVGQVTFAENQTVWVADCTTQIDYWITAGDTPAQIEEAYASVTGTVPVMPDFALGFWQCKLRYKTQEELLSVAREYRRRGLPLSVIVADFFHWPLQGDWKFDPRFWPNPEAMVAELKAMGVELMVSIWPTVDKRSDNFSLMKDQGYLVRSERGVRTSMDFMGDCMFFDATHPGARAYLWSQVKKNYYDKGIRLFWLDEAEPEFSAYDFDHYRYHLGSTQQVGNLYPVGYTQAFSDGLRAAGHEDVVSLVRCAWAGSQKYGALVWSGDIDTTWTSLRTQLAAGLNMALAGIPWWTTDIGGFGGGNPDDPSYRELLIRWFQFATFCPVMRLHGFRVDTSPQYTTVPVTQGDSSDDVFSGGPNEVWSYGEEAYTILTKYLWLRERLKPYLRTLMQAAHEKGTPVIRPLFYDFPGDAVCWQVEDQFLLGPDVLVAPLLEAGARSRRVYLPIGCAWILAETGAPHPGGTVVEVEAPLASIPIFVRAGAKVQRAWEPQR